MRKLFIDNPRLRIYDLAVLSETSTGEGEENGPGFDQGHGSVLVPRAGREGLYNAGDSNSSNHLITPAQQPEERLMLL